MDTYVDLKEPCKGCELKPGERCKVCGARQPLSVISNEIDESIFNEVNANFDQIEKERHEKHLIDLQERLLILQTMTDRFQKEYERISDVVNSLLIDYQKYAKRDPAYAEKLHRYKDEVVRFEKQIEPIMENRKGKTS